MHIIFLGTGTSHGVPSIDCMIDQYCKCRKKVCALAATDPKHSRTRSSIIINLNGHNVLIDVSADFRQQALREKIGSIDAVLITHSHADHIGGIPDIRSYTKGERELPFYGSEESIISIRKSFGYIFDPETFIGGGIPKISTVKLEGSFELYGETITPIVVEHGNLCGCFGYRIGSVGYIPDMKSISDREIRKLDGVETLILNCLRDTPEHPTHLTLSESIALARTIAPSACYFIHMCHDIHYELDSRGLDQWMQFSFDGLRLEI